MTKEQLQAAIETGNYIARKKDNYSSVIEVNGECVSIDTKYKKAYYCITIDLSDYSMQEIERKALEKSLSDKKAELKALELQMEELLKGGK